MKKKACKTILKIRNNYPQPFDCLLSIVVSSTNHRDLSAHLNKKNNLTFERRRKTAWFWPKELYFKRVSICWFSHPSTVSWGRCRRWRGTVLARGSGQCTFNKGLYEKMKICCVWCAPVKVFDHAFQLLKFFHTKFVLLQQPDCACSDILTFAF